MKTISIPTTTKGVQLRVTFGDKEGKVLSVEASGTEPMSARLLHGNVYRIEGKGAYELLRADFTQAIFATALKQGLGPEYLELDTKRAIVDHKTFLALLCAGNVREYNLESDIGRVTYFSLRFVKINRPSIGGALDPDVLVYFGQDTAALARCAEKLNKKHGPHAVYFDAFSSECDVPIAKPVSDELAGEDIPVLNFANAQPVLTALNSIKTEDPDWVQQAANIIRPATIKGSVYDYTTDSATFKAVLDWFLSRSLIRYDDFRQAAFSYLGQPSNELSGIIGVLRQPALADRQIFEIILRALSPITAKN